MKQTRTGLASRMSLSPAPVAVVTPDRSRARNQAAATAVRTTPPTEPGGGPVGPPDPAPTGRRYLQLVLVLGSLVALGPLTIDTYLPALPRLGADLAAGEAAVQLTLTGVMLGLALGQLLVGPLADAWGRKRPMIAGLTLHAVASIGCALAPTIELLTVVRVTQGLAGAAVTVTAMAMVRDLFSGRRAARLLSHLMLVLGAAPILAPTLGGWVLTLTDWRGIFVVLGGAALLLIAVAAFGLRETLPAARRRPARLGSALRTYRDLLGDRPFVGLIVVTGLMMATMFGYVSGSSFVFQQVYGLDEQAYAVVFGLNAAGLIAGTQINPFLLRRATPQRILVGAILGAFIAASGLLIAALLGAPLVVLLVPLFVTVLFTGIAFPNGPALALSRHGEAAGQAAALLGTCQFGIAGLIAPLVGALGSGSAVPMGAVMATTTALALTVLLVVVRPARLPVLDD